MGVARVRVRVRVRVQWNVLCAAHVCRYVRQLQTWAPTPTPAPEQTRLRAAESRCYIHTQLHTYIHAYNTHHITSRRVCSNASVPSFLLVSPYLRAPRRFVQ
jgi:hypothetical protein